MRWFLCTMVVVFVGLTDGQLIKRVFPTFAPCNEKLVSSIKTYWETVGKPEGALNTFEKGGTITLVHTSYNYLSQLMKCIYLKFSNGSMAVTLVPKNGTKLLQYSYNVEEDEDGVIRGKLPQNDALEYRWNWYTVYLDNGITVCYVCSSVQGSQETPLANVMLVKNDKALLKSPKISEFYNLLKGWGIKITHSYGEECILNE